ncbi:MAG: hypothetical protein FWF55_07075 [Treponema sp.]|nr:hypothetical protein [Treponema sp.]
MFFAIILFSCQTAPKTLDISLDDGYLPLEGGAYAYLIAEKDALPVLKQIMFNDINHKQIQQMIDQTNLAAAAVYVTPNEETGKSTSRYRLTAWGNYPASYAKMAFGSSKEWKKQRSALSGYDYWHSPQNGLSIALTGGIALVATSGAGAQEPPDPFSAAPGTEIPEGFDAFREGSILACWIDNPAAAISKRIAQMGVPLEIPAQRLFISLFRLDEQKYIAHLQIQLPSASHAGMLTVMFAFARNFLPPELSANLPEQDGNNLNITTAPLTIGEIALLLKTFSL